MAEKDVTPNKSNLPIKPIYILLIIIGILIVSGVFTTVYTIDETERGVLLWLGKYHSISDPGLHTKIPFGIDTLYKVPTKLQEMEFGYRTEEAGVNTRYSSGDYSDVSEMLTGDLNIIRINWSIQYRIDDPKAYLFNVERPDTTITDISQSVVNRLVGDTAILGVLGAARDRIGIQATEQMNEILSSYNIGVTIVKVAVQDTSHSSRQVQDAFDDVNVAEQNMNTLINEGKEEYNKIIPKAKGEASKIILDADAYYSERVFRARGDVARFVAVRDEWLRNPDITEARLYIEMWEAVFANTQGTELIDKNLSDNVLPLMNIEGANQ